MLQHRWCNVRRRDDWVTGWIFRHISNRFSRHPLLWLMHAYARIINQPSTIEYLIGTPAWPGHPEFDPDNLITALAHPLNENGEANFRAAYRRGNHAMAMHSAWDAHERMAAVLATPDVTLSLVHGEMSSWKGWGGDGFLAYQALIDMKDAGILGDPPDRETWCSAGPGTLHGMRWLQGMPREPKPSQHDARGFIVDLFGILRAEYPDMDLRLEDVCNILCESDKYLRVLTDPNCRLRKYTPRSAK
jgi:hypothetical protein